MNNYTNNNTEKIENALKTYYQVPAPSEKFLKSLERQITNKQLEMETEHIAPGFFKNLVERLSFKKKATWAFAPVMLAIILVFVVIALGPADVLAEVQNWLKYIPGYGFVDEDASRALAKSVSQSKDGVTVTIKQVISNEQETYVMIGMEGGPPIDAIVEYVQSSSGEEYEVWSQRMQDLYETDAQLILPNGDSITQRAFGGSYWDGFLIFSALPLDALEATLDITRLPGIPNGWAPEGWTFDLTFEYVDAPETLVFPEPYFVDVASGTLHGFNARALDVVYAPTEVTLRVQIENLPKGWSLQSAFLDARLEDDQGREYAVIYGPKTGRDQSGIYTISFEPPADDAEQLTLSINEIFVEISLEEKFITVDFGEDPSVGGTFPLDSVFDVLGHPVVVNSVRIQKEFLPGTSAQNVDEQLMNTLTFELTAPDPVDGVEIHSLQFDFEADAFPGENFAAGMSGSSPDPDNPGQLQLVHKIFIPAGIPLPTGLHQIPIRGATVLFSGPYQMSWEIER